MNDFDNKHNEKIFNKTYVFNFYASNCKLENESRHLYFI